MPITVGLESFVPHMVENFEKQIQEQVTESAQISIEPVVGETFKIELLSDSRKLLESLSQEQKEIQYKFIESQKES